MLDRAVYYIFNASNGYVIVSGDDRAEQILGYGDQPLDINTIPCNMKAWLSNYKEQIEYLQAHPNLRVETPSMMAPSLRIASVAPLLTALWDQEAPYWNQCVINGTQCLTGCPATSAAMVFHYWKYPDFMTPEVPGYRCELSTSSWSSSYVNVAPLPPVLFDWDHMRDTYGGSGSYTATEANAVATLMRYVGQAEHMAYGSSSVGSGIDADSCILIANAFKLFGYDEESVRVVKKTSAYSGGTTLYTDAEWAALIQEELAEARLAVVMPSMLTVMMPQPINTTSTSVGVDPPITTTLSTHLMDTTSISRWLSVSSRFWIPRASRATRPRCRSSATRTKRISPSSLSMAATSRAM